VRTSLAERVSHAAIAVAAPTGPPEEKQATSFLPSFLKPNLNPKPMELFGASLDIDDDFYGYQFPTPNSLLPIPEMSFN
jgi:hypothetical protein